jgi:uncharacterized coiled-coil protein SlyX
MHDYAKLEEDLAAVGKCLAALAQRVTAIETILDGLRAEHTALSDRLIALQGALTTNPSRGMLKGLIG